MKFGAVALLAASVAGVFAEELTQEDLAASPEQLETLEQIGETAFDSLVSLDDDAIVDDDDSDILAWMKDCVDQAFDVQASGLANEFEFDEIEDQQQAIAQRVAADTLAEIEAEIDAELEEELKDIPDDEVVTMGLRKKLRRARKKIKRRVVRKAVKKVGVKVFGAKGYAYYKVGKRAYRNVRRVRNLRRAVRTQDAGHVPKDCTVFYDGCNTCGARDGKLTYCTRKRCFRFGMPRCLQYE
ncbi:MAG: hypothetical protein MHM6MM_007477 [Cercozoa sp. M6MM]